MTDIVDTTTRSRMMRSIRPRDTGPELRVRRYLHACGLRFKVSPKDLLGRPDLVLPKFKTVIFVHGCFWHRHSGCRFATTPASRVDFWQHKFERNVERDQRVVRELESLGWNVLIVWECDTRQPEMLDQVFWSVLAGGTETR